VVDNDLFAGDRSDDHLVSITSRDSELLQKFVENLSHSSRLVLLDSMTNLVHYYELKFTLHLGNCQFLVHSIASGQK
jgi:hypothetical protein